ncbi:MAG: HIRAN domain-containing protein [Oscillospiraceae bacterium]|nr:HIRAN domain-containing protein [Oscillospiraceae bacterium]
MVLKTGIAGLDFNIESDEEREALENLTPGTELFLYREPDNKYDEWAISVYRTEDDKLGFITRYKNETIARLMDAGKRFVAVVDDPETDAAAKKIVETEMRRSRRAPTENMALPFSVYLIEER